MFGQWVSSLNPPTLPDKRTLQKWLCKTNYDKKPNQGLRISSQIKIHNKRPTARPSMESAFSLYIPPGPSCFLDNPTAERNRGERTTNTQQTVSSALNGVV